MNPTLVLAKVRTTNQNRPLVQENTRAEHSLRLGACYHQGKSTFIHKVRVVGIHVATV